MATKKTFANKSVHFDVINKMTEAMNRSVSWFNTKTNKWVTLVPGSYTIAETISEEGDEPTGLTATYTVNVPAAQTYVFDYWGLPTASLRETSNSASLTIKDVCIDYSRVHYTARISKAVSTTTSSKVYKFTVRIEVEG